MVRREPTTVKQWKIDEIMRAGLKRISHPLDFGWLGHKFVYFELAMAVTLFLGVTWLGVFFRL